MTAAATQTIPATQRRLPGVLPSLDFDALGTYVRLVVTDGNALDLADRLLRVELAAIDRACSRFRADSELVRANAAAGRTVPVGRLLAEAVARALLAAAQTDGDVDPTLGGCLRLAGYDRDFLALPPDGPAVVPRPVRPGGWAEVQVDVAGGRLRVPPGVELDLGATAKAFAADLAAARIAAAAGCGVLVCLGGDIALAGEPPPGGWQIQVAEQLPTDGPIDGTAPDGETVVLVGGGLATSTTTGRRWRRGGQLLHHIIDPRTGLPARPVWRMVSVAAASCVDANTASTAAVVRGRAAVGWLAGLGVPARLVDQQGRVHRVAGWPEQTTR